MSKNSTSDPKSESGLGFGPVALTLTFGFLWTDIRSLFPWFEALIDKVAS